MAPSYSGLYYILIRLLYKMIYICICIYITGSTLFGFWCCQKKTMRQAITETNVSHSGVGEREIRSTLLRNSGCWKVTVIQTGLLIRNTGRVPVAVFT